MMTVGDPQPAVAVCVRGTAARERVLRALAKSDLDPAPISPEELAADLELVTGCVAVVYDLEPFTSASVELVQALRARHPWMPILLYPTLGDGVLRLTLDVGRIPGVFAKEQVPDRGEIDRVHRFIERSLGAAPIARVTSLVALLLGDPPPRLLEFTRVAVRRLARPGSDRTVRGLALAMGIAPRTLQRSWPRDHLPNPKELMDWLTLLVVAHVAAWSSVSVRSVSRVLGVEPNTFYRLRRRLMPDAPRPRGEEPAREFDLVLLAFAERCRIPRDHAAELIEHAAG